MAFSIISALVFMVAALTFSKRFFKPERNENDVWMKDYLSANDLARHFSKYIRERAVCIDS